MKLFGAIALGLLLSLAAGACARTQTAAPQQRGPRPSSSGTLAIAAPQIGQEIPAGEKFRVVLTLSGARIVEQTSTRVVPDEGHIHITLDGQLITMTSALEQDIIVPAGAHVLEAEFVAADHFPFNPRVIAIAAFKGR
ncbi:MAG: hypothetical protein ACRDF6_03885 [bacterium]